MAKDEFREIHDLLFKTIGLFHSKFIRKFCTESPNHPELKKNHTAIIGFLYQYKVLTATELSKMLNIEKGSLTTLIDQLEELDIVIRCNDANDRRKTLISLTDTGIKEMESIMNISIYRMSEILSTANPNELANFTDSLKYAVEFMQKF